jgi:hypothetical protein
VPLHEPSERLQLLVLCSFALCCFLRSCDPCRQNQHVLQAAHTAFKSCWLQLAFVLLGCCITSLHSCRLCHAAIYFWGVSFSTVQDVEIATTK